MFYIWERRCVYNVIRVSVFFLLIMMALLILYSNLMLIDMQYTFVVSFIGILRGEQVSYPNATDCAAQKCILGKKCYRMTYNYKLKQISNLI